MTRRVVFARPYVAEAQETAAAADERAKTSAGRYMGEKEATMESQLAGLHRDLAEVRARGRAAH
jgi:hypothetical protein